MLGWVHILDEPCSSGCVQPCPCPPAHSAPLICARVAFSPCPPRLLPQGGVFVADSAQLNPTRRLAAPSPLLRISHYNAASGQLLSQFGAAGSGAGQITAPSGISASRSSHEVGGLGGWAR